MKKLLLLLVLLLPLTAFAGGRKINLKPYLAGAVPVVEGSVVFEQTVSVPGKSAAQLYDALEAFAERLVSESEHPEVSRLTLQSREEGQLAASIQEFLYFKRRKWETDYAHLFYQLVATCTDGAYTLRLQRISYIYDEERNGSNAHINAEGWITDADALTKDGKNLRKEPGKFRRFTIDRVNQLFEQAQEAAKGQ